MEGLFEGRSAIVERSKDRYGEVEGLCAVKNVESEGGGLLARKGSS